MLFVALGWSLLEAIRIDWAHHEKLPLLRIYNQHIHQKCTFTPLGATVPIVTKKKKKRFEQIFHSWKDIVHWNDRLRRNCCKLEDLGMLSGALPVHEGRFYYFLGHWKKCCKWGKKPPLAFYNYKKKKKAKHENGMSQIDNRTDAFKKFAVFLKKKKKFIHCRGSFCKHPHLTCVLFMVVEMITN